MDAASAEAMWPDAVNHSETPASSFWKVAIHPSKDI
jgi:hypothetical protein